MDVKTIALILCLEAVNVYTVEPSCSDAALGVNILEHTLETRTIVKLLHSEIAGIRDGLNCPTQSVNDRIQVDYIRQNLTQLSDKLEEMKAKLDSFVSQGNVHVLFLARFYTWVKYTFTVSRSLLDWMTRAPLTYSRTSKSNICVNCEHLKTTYFV